MGGFYLTGPNYKFSYVHQSDLRCKCMGYHANISKNLEDILLTKNFISETDLIKFLTQDGLSLNEHIHFGLEENKIYKYIAKKL